MYNKTAPFSIVKGMYPDVQGTTSLGLFVLVYMDERDKEIHYKQNVVGLKITSKPLFLDKYSYALPNHRVKFLDKDSWVQCNKPIVLDTEKVQEIGVLDLGLRMAIYRRFKEFLTEADSQMLDNISVRGDK